MMNQFFHKLSLLLSPSGYLLVPVWVLRSDVSYLVWPHSRANRPVELRA